MRGWCGTLHKQTEWGWGLSREVTNCEVYKVESLLAPLPALGWEEEVGGGKRLGPAKAFLHSAVGCEPETARMALSKLFCSCFTFYSKAPSSSTRATFPGWYRIMAYSHQRLQLSLRGDRFLTHCCHLPSHPVGDTLYPFLTSPSLPQSRKMPDKPICCMAKGDVSHSAVTVRAVGLGLQWGSWLLAVCAPGYESDSTTVPAMACFGWSLWKSEVLGLKHPSDPTHLSPCCTPSFAYVQEILSCRWTSRLKAVCSCPWLFAGVGCAWRSLLGPVPVGGWALWLPEPLVGMRRGSALCWGAWQLQESIPNVEGSIYFLKWRVQGSLRYQGQISTMTRRAVCQTQHQYDVLL